MIWLVSMYVTLSSFHTLNLIKLFMNIILGYAVILPYHFMTFTSEVKQMWHMYKYVLKHPLREDRFKQKNQNVVFRDYILTLASYTVHSRV